MKKRIWIIAGIFLVALFIPIPTGVCKDGGTRTYTALTYKIVDWNRTTGPVTTYNTTKVYWLPNNFKDTDTLWGFEESEAEHSFNATVLEVNKNSVLVQPDSDQPIANCCDKISFNTKNLIGMNLGAGVRLTITYKGGIMESYPAQIHAIDWKPYKLNIVSNVGSFIYEDDYAFYQGEPGFKESGFINTGKNAIETADEAVRLALYECNVGYDNAAVDFDSSSKVYRVSFWKENTAGGDQIVYINSDGITQFIFYGE